MAEVLVAESAGFCFGVKRAVNMAEETARERGSCLSLGPIIHNNDVVTRLEALGVHAVKSLDEV
ncbi:MAG: 4-hydroxy-3-methylbut-2-enyl diphosphate reductase, partial [bacterium]